MAIDDNTLYGLTGAQVKELPGKIEAVKGKPKVLTADDYNYPTDNPSSVALWLLEAGVYIWGAGMRVYTTTTIYDSGYGGSAIVLKDRESATPFSYILSVNNAKDNFYCVSPIGIGVGSNGEILVSGSVIDNLTTSTPYRPLSANQGKVLNDKIGGDLSNLTTTDKTSLINAINEVAGSGVSDVQIDGTSIVSGGVANIGYASTATGGVIRVNSSYGVNVAGTGTLIGATKSYSSYDSGSDLTVITKGTLENVITGKGLVSNTDYASNAVGGVIKTNTNYGTNVDSNGSLRGTTKTYADYGSMHDLGLISKVTLENVITGKGLVSNTDYGSFATAGVVKASSTYGTQFASTGAMYAQTKTYEQYTDTTSPGLFIGKGTLENVIEGKGLVSNTDYADAGIGGVIKTGSSYGTDMASSGNLKSVVKTYDAYSSAGNYMFVSKGTLENVITGKGLVSNTDYANNTTAGVIRTSANYGTTVSGSGVLNASTLSYEAYTGANNTTFVGKGTLENVIAGKGLPTLTLSTTDIGEGASLPANTLYGVYE